MKKVIIYPGRFQPMLSHHAEVYDRLKAEYPGVDVYFGTSNKVEENKSPFSFKEKQLIATAQGIDPNKVLLANRPYVWDDYAKYFDADKTHIFFAVGEKDMEDDPRFTFNNIDTKSGLDMKLRPNKDTGEVEPKYYQMINTYKDDPRPMSQRGYIVQAPNVMSSGEDVASASAFRKALIDSPDKESAREIFNKQYKEYNESVFDLIYKKIVGDKMNEDLNTLMKLAGLEVQEDAPVEFDTPLKPEEIKFSPVSKSSSVMSIANRFPSGQDVNDPEVKKEEFLKALMKSPSSILSEINERILPDENGLEVSKKLSEIIDSMRDKGFMDIDKDDRGFVLDVVKNALKNMELKAGDERDFDPETSSLESVELDDIRSDYGIAEGVDEEDSIEYENDLAMEFVKLPLASMSKEEIRSEMSSIFNTIYSMASLWDEPQTDAGNAMEKLGTSVEDSGDYYNDDWKYPSTNHYPDYNDEISDNDVQTIIKYQQIVKDVIGRASLDQDPKAPELFNSKDGGQNEELNDLRKRAGLEVKEDEKYYANDPTFVDPDGPRDEGVYANYVTYIGPNGEEVGNEDYDDELGPDMMAQMVSDEECKMLCDKHDIDYNDTVGCLKFDAGEATMQDGEELPDGTIAFYGGKEGLLDDIREPVEEGKMKDIIMDLKDMSKEEFCSAHPQHADEYEDLCKQYDDDAQSEPQESFDAGAEQSREEEAYNELMDAYQKDGEEGLCKAIGCSHEELDREMTEWAMDHNLHMDDDRDEVIHGYIEDLVDNADWKDHGEYESIEEAMCGCCGNDPCNCPKDCDGCRKDEAVEDITAKALDTAMAELRTLAGI